MPSGGYTKGLPASKRTDVGEGDITPERLGRDFFPYRPTYLRWEPPMASLARLTNVVQQALASGQYVGAIWLEGSPFVEETSYWLNLLIDTPVLLPKHLAQRRRGSCNDGDRNIIDAVDYICRASGRITMVGTASASWSFRMSSSSRRARCRRPMLALRMHSATGGHGGIIGTMGQPVHRP